MSVRSFRSVFMVGGVAAAALSCYLVSLRVASERAELENVESQIVLAQRDIRLLQTEIGTRGRLAQLERWNVRVLLLSAPTADQIVGDSFQLARMVRPDQKLDVEAPVVYASAPQPEPEQVLPAPDNEDAQSAPSAKLLYEASLKTPTRSVPPAAEKEAKPKAEAAKPKKEAVATPAKPKSDPVKLAEANTPKSNPSGNAAKKTSSSTTKDSDKAR